jgi:outer membrane lipoprotein LolB
MYYWVRAIPSPKVVVKGSSFDQYNHLISLSQFGWRIRYADFKSINSMDLPTKIYMDSPNLHVKMVFQWDI